MGSALIRKDWSRVGGLSLARKVFAQRGRRLPMDHSEIHLRLDELAALLAVALELGHVCGATKAPDGWWCTRALLHEGPCAAHEVAEWEPTP